MILEILFVSIIAIIFGIIIAYILFKKGIHLPTKANKEKNKIINNPDLLLEKLNSNGKMVDLGEELKYSVVEENGKRHLDLKKIKIPVEKKVKEKTKEPVKAKPVGKKPAEK